MFVCTKIQRKVTKRTESEETKLAFETSLYIAKYSVYPVMHTGYVYHYL